MKYFDPSLSQFTPKIYRFRFPQPHQPKSLMDYVSLGHRTEKTISVLSPSLTTWNISILPSASSHWKYVGFVSLSLVGKKINGFCFSQFCNSLKKFHSPQPHDPMYPPPPSIKPDLWPETQFKHPSVVDSFEVHRSLATSSNSKFKEKMNH